MRRFTIVILTVAVAMLALAPAALSKGEANNHFTAQLTSAAEVPAPATPTTAHGTAHFSVSNDGSTVSYKVVVNQHVAPVVAAHIHKAPVGVAGPVVVPLLPAPSVKVTNNTTVFSGTFPMAAYPAFIADANAGLLYVNVHTPANPPGETRGQIS